MENNIFFSKESPAMLAAFEQAQTNFKYFWRELYWERRRIVPALNFAFVKMAFAQEGLTEPNGEPTVEYMWIGNIDFDGITIRGTLDNEPGKLTNVKVGDVIERPISGISDWMFAINGRAYGGYTVQVLRQEMDDSQRAEHDKAWGLDFGDPDNILAVYEQDKHPDNLIEHPMSKNMQASLKTFLTENPIHVNSKDDLGYTMLHREAIAGNKACVEVLLEMGADAAARTNGGYTAADFARMLKWEHF